MRLAIVNKQAGRKGCGSRDVSSTTVRHKLDDNGSAFFFPPFSSAPAPLTDALIPIILSASIFSGAQVCISYGPTVLSGTADRRRADLKATMGFHCECAVCSAEDADADFAEVKMKQYRCAYRHTLA